MQTKRRVILRLRQYAKQATHLFKQRRSRTIRSLAACMLLLVALVTLVAVYHDTHHTVTLRVSGPIKPSLATRGGTGARKTDELLYRPDGRGGTVRVAVFMLATKFAGHICDALASAYFTDIPVILIGHDEPYPNHLVKPNFFLRAIEAAGLSDEDVILALDSDIVFASQDLIALIDRFIALSPPSPGELDVRAVRKGEAMAPSFYSIELRGYNAETEDLFPKEKADATMNALADLANNYSAQYGGAYFIPTNTDSQRFVRHINSGVSIHRVWAFRELITAYHYFAKVEKSVKPGHPTIIDDQGIVQGLFVYLIRWEVENDALGNTSVHLGRTKHGLRAGVLGLDYTLQLCIIASTFEYDNHLLLMPTRWGVQLSKSPGYIFKYNIYWTAQKFRQILRTIHWKVPAKQIRVSSFGANTVVNIAPPLLAVNQSFIGESYRSTSGVHSAIVHCSGPSKKKCFHETIVLTTWYIPMRHNKASWDAGRAYLESMHVVRWNQTEKRRDRFVDLCPSHLLHKQFVRASV